MKQPEKFWDKVAPKNPKPTLSLGKTSHKTVELTKEYLKQEDTVLDFGCGGAIITLAVAYHVQSIEGIDLSQGMIKAAIQAKTTYGNKNAQFRQCSIFDEQIKSGKYDVIIAFNVLHFITDLAETTNRINSLLKPGGLFISSTACPKEKKSLTHLIVKMVTSIGLIPKMNNYNVKELSATIEEANFEIIQTKMVSSLPECFIVAKKP